MAVKPRNPKMYDRWTDPSNGKQYQYLGKAGWKLTGQSTRPTPPAAPASSGVTAPPVAAPPATPPRRISWTDLYNDPSMTEGVDTSTGSSLTSLFSKYGLSISPTGQVRSATVRELFNPVGAGGLAEGDRQLTVGGQTIKGVDDVVGRDTATDEANKAGLSGSILGDLIVAIRRNAIRASEANAAGGITGGGVVSGGAQVRKSGEQGSWNKFLQDLMSGLTGIGAARSTGLTDLLRDEVVAPDAAPAAAPAAGPAPVPGSRPAAGANLGAGPNGDFIRLVEDISVSGRRPEAGMSKAQRKKALEAMEKTYTLSAQQKRYIKNLIASGNY